MKNTMLDLHNHLFMELERLGDEDLTGEELKRECQRAEAIKGTAHEIILNARTVMKAEEMKRTGVQVPDMITGEKPEPKIPFFKERKAIE